MGLAERLEGIIPAEDLRQFSCRYDVIGDIAIFTLPPALQKHDQVIAAAIRELQHRVRVVLEKKSMIRGNDRTAEYRVVSGSGTTTTHREFGFSYRLDVTTCFFAPRLSSERKRVISQVRSGESVLVLFCGVGPFVIPAAAQGAFITAVEQNLDACSFLEENIAANRVTGRVNLIRGDVFQEGIVPPGPFDRAIVPTPYGRDDVLDLITSRLRAEGKLHFYTFRNRGQSEVMERRFREEGFQVLCRRRCGNVAPAVSRWVFDLVAP